MRYRSKALGCKLEIVFGFLFMASFWCGPTASKAEADTRLKLIVWNFQVDTVKEFVRQFEAENSDLKVEMEVIPSGEYVAKVQLMRNGGTPFDALYVFDHVLSQWASWLEPLDSYEGADKLKAAMLPLARQSMTYKGKLYGLPYYTSYFGVIYNEKMMTAAGISAPPKTYDEWIRQARMIKETRLSKTPLIWPVKHTGWGGIWVINTMVASRGGKLLDDKLNATSEALQALKWWADTYRQGLSDPNGIELDSNDSARAFMSGEYYTILTANFFAGPQWANNKSNSKIAGFAHLAATPDEHKTAGFARLYGINGNSGHKAEAWRLIKFLGGTDKKGDYVTPKQWVEKGTLTWGYRGVEKDSGVAASLASWGADPAQVEANLEGAVHMSQIVPFQAPWYAEWELYANGVLQDVLSGRASPEDATRLWSEKASALAARYQ